MSETQMLTIACSLVATLFGLLVCIIGYGGAKVLTKLEDIVEKLHDVAGELHERINGIDRRLTRVETRCEEHRT